MSKTVIRVENLSKKYRIQHQRETQRYVTLRDAVTDKLLSTWRRFSNPQSAIRNSQSEEDFWALRDVSFEVKEGGVIGIIGRNGAGKSTLLKILSRITEPTNGSVGIRGRVASLLEVGTGFHPELTGRENIYLNGAVLGMTREEIKRKFEEIVGFAEIEKFLDTPVKRYSSGMYVRLAFAVAAHLEPEILIVDEVLAVGDIEFQKKCLGKMSTVARGGRTVLFVSHNMSAVIQLCTQAMLLERGTVLMRGKPHEVIQEYLHTIKEATTTQWVAKGQNDSGQRVFLQEAQIREVGHGNSSLSNGMILLFEAIIIVNNPDAYSACLVFKREGQEIFFANTYHNGQKLIIPSPGKYAVKFYIPAYLLNPGYHTVSIYVTDARGAHEHYIRQDDLLGFDLQDDNVRRGQVFSGGWPGAVCPLLDFDVEFVSKEEYSPLSTAKYSPATL